MAETDAEWRTIDGVLTAWFRAPSLVSGAALAARIIERPAAGPVDLRADGVRVRVDPPDAERQAEAISAAARELGLVADPGGLQQVAVVIESSEPDPVRDFWRQVLAYDDGEEGDLVDPLRRDPGLRIRSLAEQRPLRNRIHLDVVRPTETVERLELGEAGGPYGVRLADPDGNEVDLVPGDALGEDEATADWRSVFSAVAGYHTDSPAQQRELVTAVAALADDAGFPLLIDVRPGLVILDSAKDRWEDGVHAPPEEVAALAARIQRVARDLGATADPGLARFTQLFLDAADLAAVRGFWRTTLGYVEDPRTGLSDIIDPRRLNPELVFQELDPAETDRRRQRNRMHVELVVPADQAEIRLATAVAAGGTLLDDSDGRHRVADPEGNELVIIPTS